MAALFACVIRFADGSPRVQSGGSPAGVADMTFGLRLDDEAKTLPTQTGVKVLKLLRALPFGNGHSQHIVNPSNLGVGSNLLLFPEVGFSPPYHFTENIRRIWDWIVPLIVLTSGIIVHGLFTGRLILVGARICACVLQGFIRAEIFGVPLFVPLMPMTSAAFIVFTLYMIPDSATTPLKPSSTGAFLILRGVGACDRAVTAHRLRPVLRFPHCLCD